MPKKKTVKALSVADGHSETHERDGHSVGEKFKTSPSRAFKSVKKKAKSMKNILFNGDKKNSLAAALNEDVNDNGSTSVMSAKKTKKTKTKQKGLDKPSKPKSTSSLSKSKSKRKSDKACKSTRSIDGSKASISKESTSSSKKAKSKRKLKDVSEHSENAFHSSSNNNITNLQTVQESGGSSSDQVAVVLSPLNENTTSSAASPLGKNGKISKKKKAKNLMKNTEEEKKDVMLAEEEQEKRRQRHLQQEGFKGQQRHEESDIHFDHHGPFEEPAAEAGARMDREIANEVIDIPYFKPNQQIDSMAEDINDDYTDIRESQLLLEVPPIGEIVATATDDEEVSEIGEGPADAGIVEAEIIDGIEIIYNPHDKDICFDDRGHPGTTDLIHVLRELLKEFEATEYSPPIYKAIKKRLKGRRFLIRTRRDDRTSWKEASKPEVIQLLGDCFNEERRRQREGISDDVSEIDSSLQDSAQQPSDASEDGDGYMVSPPGKPPSRKQTPRHSNMNPAKLPKRTESLQPRSNKNLSKDDDSRVTDISGSLRNGSISHSSRQPLSGSLCDASACLKQAIIECQTAQDYARPFDNVDGMQQGIAAEEKLQMLLDLADAPKTQKLKKELRHLEDLAKRMKYASLAPMLAMLEKIEGHATEYFQICSENSGGTFDEKDINGKKEGTDRSSDGDTGQGVRHNRSIAVMSDTGHDRESDRQRSEIDHTDEEPQHELEVSHLSIPLKGGDESGGLDDKYNRSEASISYTNGLQKSNTDGSFDKSYEQAGETYTISMNNGSYIEGESNGNFNFDDSHENLYRNDSGNVALNTCNEGKELLDEQDIDEYEEDGELVEEYMEEDGASPSSDTNVEDGHVLELDQKSDELSSVGDSMPGIYGSDSDDDKEEMEIIEIVEDHTEEEGSQTSESDDDISIVTPTPSKPRSIFEKPNPKVEQFFDRLQHFFEVKRKTDERAIAMDPSKKFRSLKVKIHSGGILNSDGTYKKEYQQHDLKGKLVRNLDDLYDSAEPAQAELNYFLDQMVEEVKGLEKEHIILPTLKPRDRAFEKAKSEYGHRNPGPPESWLFDIVRAGVICKSYKQMSDVNKWLGKHCHVVQAKNRFAEPAFNGYRDLLFHVSIPFRDELAHVCEIQVHHKVIIALNDQYGLPKHYEFFRSCFVSPWRSQEKTLEDLSLLCRFGKMEGPLMKKLLKSKDPEQLRLVAGLCRDKLGEFTRALELYRRVLNLQEDDHGTDHEDMASTYLGIGLVLGAMGDTEESLLNLQKALAIQESCLGSDNIQVADSYAEIGHMLTKKGDYSGALSQYQRALGIRQTKLGKEHFLVIKSLQDIGLALHEKGDFRQSEEQYRRALKIQEEVLGDVHPDVATTHALIGSTLCQHGDFGKSMEEHRLALSIRETGLGKNHPSTAESHTDIGVLLCQKGDYEFSEWRHRKALRIREAMRGKDHEECAISHGYLGEVLSRRGDYDGAVAELKRAQEIREANVGMDSPITAGSYIDLGNIYCRHGKHDEALTEYRRAKVIRESILGPSHPDTALAYMCVGNALSLEGNHKAALAELRKALAVFESVLGKSHPRTATGYQSLADALLANGNQDEALIGYRKALAIRANILAKDHPDTSKSCSRIGDLLSGKGDLVGALVAYRQALAITVGLCGEDHPDSAKAHVSVGRVLAAQGDLDEAMDEIQQALTVRESCLGADHELTAQGYQMLGSLHSMQGEFEEAHEYHSKAIESFVKMFGKKHPETAAARKKLAMAETEEEEEEI